MQTQRANELIQLVKKFAEEHPHIAGALLVGSYAHENARAESDLDICLFTERTDLFFANHDWLHAFGETEKMTYEDWGNVRTLRTFFSDGAEVEFNFNNPSWASIDPIDPGTFRVVNDGAKILYDPAGSLDNLLKAVLATRPGIRAPKEKQSSR